SWPTAASSSTSSWTTPPRSWGRKPCATRTVRRSARSASTRLPRARRAWWTSRPSPSATNLRQRSSTTASTSPLTSTSSSERPSGSAPRTAPTSTALLWELFARRRSSEEVGGGWCFPQPSSFSSRCHEVKWLVHRLFKPVWESPRTPSYRTHGIRRK
ncbi:unnamed protein product, partial [Ectocarpus sp. 13 AM-2016]